MYRKRDGTLIMTITRHWRRWWAAKVSIALTAFAISIFLYVRWGEFWATLVLFILSSGLAATPTDLLPDRFTKPERIILEGR